MDATGHLKLPALLENLPAITACVTAAASAAGFSARRIGEIDLALEEAVTNVFKYASPGKAGEIEITCSRGAGAFTVELRYSGREFDITRLPDPDLAQDIAERPVGGLGAYLIKKMADGVSYRRLSGLNVLTLVFREIKTP